MLEFTQAMREFGLQAPADAVATVFQSFDKDRDGNIAYNELHRLLIRSVQTHPRLVPVKTKSEMKFNVRKSPVKKSSSNLLGDLTKLDRERSSDAVDPAMPDKIRAALQKNFLRVIDLFRQIDDDADGKISVFEFIKAMRELGLQAPPQEIVPVFNAVDRDHSGFLELREFERHLRSSVTQGAHLTPITSRAPPKRVASTSRSPSASPARAALKPKAGASGRSRSR